MEPSAQEVIWLVYDHDCPVCRTYCKYVRIRDTVRRLRLVDARQPGALMDEITAAGLDIDQGMVLRLIAEKCGCFLRQVSSATEGNAVVDGVRKVGMICGCLLSRSPNVLPTHTDFRVCVPWPRCAACSATARRASSHSFAAQKNDLCGMRDGTSRMVRPFEPSGARSVQRGHAHLSRIRGATRRLPQLCSGEARATVLPGRQHALHAALCLLRGPALPQHHAAGSRPGASS